MRPAAGAGAALAVWKLQNDCLCFWCASKAAIQCTGKLPPCLHCSSVFRAGQSKHADPVPAQGWQAPSTVPLCEQLVAAAAAS